MFVAVLGSHSGAEQGPLQSLDSDVLERAKGPVVGRDVKDVPSVSSRKNSKM